ncbi:rhomboid family intramembrane serine protease [Rhodobacter sp. KR11]|jgi:membrane associated rhomboid family serine protease|uniref:rhomboid family intramembrane serine protease n=1 Tax=Rhodobacter sp. KR11 TaxID=2974588 RepID=UPI002221D213|nr:rhomboid family intramembrane serine protease [Rhodobacter sp. KR11]MCW1918503.1 rhomboid family intramembrane serine protease [Rhodobacter sp. KR11]
MDQNTPLNPLPAIAWVLALPMIALEIVISAGENGLVGGPGAIGWRSEAIQMLAFSPEYLRQMLVLGQFPADGLWRPFTHVFVNSDLTGALFSVVILLALAKFTGEVFRWWAVAVIFLASAALGAVAYTAVPWTQAALTGGWPANYGLIGAFTWVQWMRGRLTGTQTHAFRLIGFLLGVRVAFGVVALVAGGLDQSEGWIWVADAAGFAVGFALSFVVVKGGWQALLSRIRQR